MKLFYITPKISLISIFSLSLVISAHATDINCGDEIDDNFNGQVIELDHNLTCSKDDNANYALLISGDNIHLLLNDYSITAADRSQPARGISITGKNNDVIGPGSVRGFGFDAEIGGNIVIENANDNHVSGLSLQRGEMGIVIFSHGSGQYAERNYISHNTINGPTGDGFDIRATNGGSTHENFIYNNTINGAFKDGISIVSMYDNSSASANHVYHNTIEGANDGISLIGFIDGTTNNNYVYDNFIKKVSEDGISLSAVSSGSTDNNHIYDNSIEDPAKGGIYVLGYVTGTANQNYIIHNHILRPGLQSIELDAFSFGHAVGNTIKFNVTEQPQSNEVYCDSNESDNTWIVNYIDNQRVPDDHSACK